MPPSKTLTWNQNLASITIFKYWHLSISQNPFVNVFEALLIFTHDMIIIKSLIFFLLLHPLNNRVGHCILMKSIHSRLFYSSWSMHIDENSKLAIFDVKAAIIHRDCIIACVKIASPCILLTSAFSFHGVCMWGEKIW